VTGIPDPPVSIRDLLEFPPTVDVLTAARVLGMGRTTAYTLVRSGRFPCRVIRVGSTYRVPTAELHRLVGLTPIDSPPSGVDGSGDNPSQGGVRTGLRSI
jgi:excisionase family DNA binding protein